MSTPRRRNALIMLWASYVGLYLNRRNISVVLPILMSNMGLSHTEAGMLITAFFFAYSAMQIPAGWLSDLKGGRLVLLLGNAVTTVSGALSGVASSYPFLLATRIVCGVGQGMGWPSSSKLVAGYFPGGNRGAAMGFLTSSVALGSFLALVAAGLILEGWGWRATFIVPAILLAILTAVAWSMDLGERQRGINSGDAPPLSRVYRNRGILALALSYFFWKYSFEGLTYWLPALLVEGYGLAPSHAATLSGLIILAGLVSMPLGGWLSDHVGSRAGIIIFSLSGAGVLLLSLPLLGGGQAAIPALTILSFTMQMSEGLYFTIPLDLLGADVAGTAIGFINLGGQAGSLTAPWIIGLLLDHYRTSSAVFAMLGALTFAGVAPLVGGIRSGRSD